MPWAPRWRWRLSAGASRTAPRRATRATRCSENAAQRLNVTPDKLRSALDGAAADQLDQAVKDGKLTQRQADRIEQQIREHGVPLGGPMGGPGGPGGPGDHRGPFGRHGGPGHGPFAMGLDAAASYLGLSRSALDRQLRAGRTLADVARAQGKTVAGLEQALVDAAKTRLDRAVADRRLTARQRDEILREVREHVGDLVAGRRPGPPPAGRARGARPGGPGGPPPWGGPRRHP